MMYHNGTSSLPRVSDLSAVDEDGRLVSSSQTSKSKDPNTFESEESAELPRAFSILFPPACGRAFSPVKDKKATGTLIGRAWKVFMKLTNPEGVIQEVTLTSNRCGAMLWIDEAPEALLNDTLFKIGERLVG